MKVPTFFRKRKDALALDMVSTVSFRTPWGELTGMRVIGFDISGGDDGRTVVNLRLQDEPSWLEMNRCD